MALPKNPPANPSRWLSVGIAGVIVAFGVFLVGGLIDDRPSARMMSCRNNIHNIALALHQYHDALGCFPPPYIADANGKPMHSWRVLLLPFLDQQQLHRRYRFDEPWDGPNNAKLHDAVIKVYSCPAHAAKQSSTDTSYAVVVGPETFFPESGFCRMADVIDGTSNTIMLVEVHNSGIHWMEPRDLHISQMPLAINPPRGQGISSEHKGGANVVFVDGSVHFLTNDTPPTTLRAWLTSSGREPVSPPR